MELLWIEKWALQVCMSGVDVSAGGEGRKFLAPFNQEYAIRGSSKCS
jgi:hypothetical protein